MRDFRKNVIYPPAMQIICPNCTTAYEVPDSAFGGRARKVSCENCGTQWRAGPPGAGAQPQSAPPPAAAAPPAQPARVFGKPMDATAEAEFLAARGREMQATASQPAPPVHESQAATNSESDDSFINLVMAARSRAIEFEPEPKPEPRIRITSPALAGGLLTLFVVSFAYVVFVHH